MSFLYGKAKMKSVCKRPQLSDAMRARLAARPSDTSILAGVWTEQGAPTHHVHGVVIHALGGPEAAALYGEEHEAGARPSDSNPGPTLAGRDLGRGLPFLSLAHRGQ